MSDGGTEKFDLFGELDAFAEAKTTESATGSHRREQDAADPPVRARPLLRLVGLVVLVIVAVVLVVELFQGSDTGAADRRYLDQLSPVASDSQRAELDVARLLGDGTLSKGDLGPLDRALQQARTDLARAQALSPPFNLRAEHEHAVEAFALRVSGLEGLRTILGQASGSARTAASTALLAAEMGRLLTSDVVWNDLVRGPALEELKRQRVAGVTLPLASPGTTGALTSAQALATALQPQPGTTTGRPTGSTQTPGVLKLGDTGAAVTAWQTSLNAWLAKALPSQAPLKVDGVFGVTTQAATGVFQRAAGISADGVVGPATTQALARATATARSQPAPSGTGG